MLPSPSIYFAENPCVLLFALRIQGSLHIGLETYILAFFARDFSGFNATEFSPGAHFAFFAPYFGFLCAFFFALFFAFLGPLLRFFPHFYAFFLTCKYTVQNTITIFVNITVIMV